MSSAEQDVGVDIDSTLSSLFFLQDGSDAITLPPDPNAPVNTSSTRQLLSVATSIAAICVRQPTSEVFACSLSISCNSLEIYLAENHLIDTVTIAYLDRILTRLVDTSESQTPDGNFTDHVMSTLAVVLEFTLPKFLHSISRRDEDWDACMARIEAQPLLDHERSAFVELRDRVVYVYKAAQLCASQRSDKYLRTLAMFLGYLRAFFEGPDKDVIAGVLKTMDVDSRLDDEAAMAEDLDPESMSQGFSLTRYVARMSSIMVHVLRLVTLAVVPTYKHLFTRARPPLIHYLTPVPKTVLIDTGAALRFLADNRDDASVPSDIFSSADDTIHPINECSHAELTLFQRLLMDALQGPGGLSAYWVIGTSRLMCAGCYATIARAYPKLLESMSDQLRTLRPFLVQGCHGKLYAPWIPPTLSSLDELVGFDFDRRIKAATLDVLKDDLMAIVSSRRLSGSSAGSPRATKTKFKLFKTPEDRSDFQQHLRERVRKIR